MAEFLKPDNLNNVWASGGDRLYPGDTKYASGWGVEIPPRQYFNQIDFKQDQMLAHLNQRGIAEWDATTEYQADKSYVQDSTGVLYKCILTNIGNNPATDATETYWKIALLTAEDLPQVASNIQAQEMLDDSTYISPLKLAEAFGGANQVNSESGCQVLPGGVKLQWTKIVVGAASSTTWTFPKPCSSGVFNIQLTKVSAAGEDMNQHVYVASNNLTSVTVDNSPGTTQNTCYIFVIGI